MTDANLVAGRLGSETSLAGGITLDRAAALESPRADREDLGLEPAAVARGILEVVDALMEQAIRKVSIEQGIDPRQAPLLAFGGAGGLHATGLAKRLDMPAVVIPPHAGVFSALGLLLSPGRHDLARTLVMPQGSAELSARIDEIHTEVVEGVPRRHRLGPRHDRDVGRHEISRPVPRDPGGCESGRDVGGLGRKVP